MSKRVKCMVMKGNWTCGEHIIGAQISNYSAMKLM